MLTGEYSANLIKLKGALRSDESFDLVQRNLVINNRKSAMFFIDGFIKDDIIEKILEFFYKNLTDEKFQICAVFFPECRSLC